MEERDRSIITQVAFKAATEFGVKADLDLSDAEGQGQFEKLFSFLTESIFGAISAGASPSEQAANIIQANFPGAQPVADVSPPAQYTPMPQAQPQFAIMVKGKQFGPLPDWLYEQAAAVGVTEVYDNRDRIAGTRRPWFKSTTGGDDAPAFWPPRS